MSSLMDKIQMVDPMNALAPMRNDQPEAAKDDREKSVSEAVQEEVENRMTKAAEELKQKYARGDGGKDNSENGPTGAAYTAAAVAERERRRGLKHKEDAAAQAAEERDLEREFAVRAQVAAARGSDDDDSDGEGAKDDDDEVDSDDEFLQDLEGDPEIARIRAQRLQQIKGEQLALQEQRRNGYGLLSEIVQDEFLPKITAAKKCVVHFYHNDFHRCRIMDKHLEILAHNHPETLFLKINAEKAPFFCSKLDVVVLPTVICFFDGITKNGQRQIGFIGLDPVPGGNEDEWPTTALESVLGNTGVINYVAKATAEELRKYGLAGKTSITAGRSNLGMRGDDDE